MGTNLYSVKPLFNNIMYKTEIEQNVIFMLKMHNNRYKTQLRANALLSDMFFSSEQINNPYIYLRTNLLYVLYISIYNISLNIYPIP